MRHLTKQKAFVKLVSSNLGAVPVSSAHQGEASLSKQPRPDFKSPPAPQFERLVDRLQGMLLKTCFPSQLLSLLFSENQLVKYL